MNKFQLFSIFVILFTFPNYGQSNISELETENGKLKTELSEKETKIKDLTKEIEYYKQTLELIDSKITADDKDVTFKINSVNGNSDTGKVIVEGILINNGALRQIQGKKANAIDPKGNSSMSYKVKFGDAIRIEKVLKDIPTKFNVELEQMEEGTPMIKALIIDFHSKAGYKFDDLNVIFKNLNIDWK